MFHNDKATIHCSNKNLDNRLLNNKATIHSINKNINKRLASIMTRLPSIGVTKITKTDYLP